MLVWTGPIWLAAMLAVDLLLLGPSPEILLYRLPVLVCWLGWTVGWPAAWPWPVLTPLTGMTGQALAIVFWSEAGATAPLLAAGALALALPAALWGRAAWPLATAPAKGSMEAEGDDAAGLPAVESVPKPVLRIAGDTIQAHLAILGDGLDRLAYGTEGARIRPLCAEVKQIRIAVEQALGSPPQQSAQPQRDPPILAASPTPRVIAPTRRPLSILLVDEDVVGRTMIRLLLEKEGHLVEETDDAKMALEMALMEGPELALISARIGRHRGLALAWCIYRGKGPPVILLRGPADRAMEADIQRAGLRGVLEKPVTPARLEAALDTFLASSSPPEDATAALAVAELNQELLADHLRLLGPDRLGQIIDSFVSNAPETLENAARAAGEGDVHNLGRAAHKLASGALTVGAVTLAALAKGIDTAAKRNEADAALAQAQQLEAEWLAAKAALTQFRQGL